MKPVTVRGMYDHMKEIQVEKINNGEKGVEIIVPFYTHLDANGEPCAILVNRGWVPHDLKHLRMHKRSSAGSVSGILYPGDAKNKWSVPNSPTIEHY